MNAQISKYTKKMEDVAEELPFSFICTDEECAEALSKMLPDITNDEDRKVINNCITFAKTGEINDCSNIISLLGLMLEYPKHYEKLGQCAHYLNNVADYGEVDIGREGMYEVFQSLRETFINVTTINDDDLDSTEEESSDTIEDK